jgi:hypothetical protein
VRRLRAGTTPRDSRKTSCGDSSSRGRAIDRRAALPLKWVAVPVLLVALAVGLRAPWFDVPLTADEGGYAEIARLWAHGGHLYGGLWVDRPQGLIIVFRALLAVGITSAVGFRLAAAGLAAILVVLTFAVGARLSNRRTGALAAGLVATAGASPFIESFTLSGELLASVLATFALLTFACNEKGGGLAWLAVSGAAAGSAWMVKQSAFDATAAIAICLALDRETRSRFSVFVGAAMIPVLIGVVGSGDPSAWYRDVIGYGLNASAGESPTQRISAFGHSTGPAAKALLPLASVAGLGWRHAPRIAKLWLAAACVGVVMGGNFHLHYYLQLVVPLSLVAACISLPGRLGVWIVATAGAATVAFALQLSASSDVAQAKAIWPGDAHLLSDGAVARFLSRHSADRQSIYVVWAAADLYYIADRRPASPYLWLRNLQTIRGAAGEVQQMLGERKPQLVVLEQLPGLVDPTGRTQALLARDYHPIARVAGVRILARRGQTPIR